MRVDNKIVALWLEISFLHVPHLKQRGPGARRIHIYQWVRGERIAIITASIREGAPWRSEGERRHAEWQERTGEQER